MNLSLSGPTESKTARIIILGALFSAFPSLKTASYFNMVPHMAAVACLVMPLPPPVLTAGSLSNAKAARVRPVHQKVFSYHHATFLPAL